MGEARRRKRLDPNWGKANRHISDDRGHEMVGKIVNNPRTIMLSSIAHAMALEYIPCSKYSKED
jgi:hypothetical protein